MTFSLTGKTTRRFLLLALASLCSFIDNQSQLMATATTAEESESDDNGSTTKNEEPNPYFSGCLQQKREGWKNKPRVCIDRYDTSLHQEIGLCRQAPFDYMEIRIATGNWESATALGWLTQIILSEIVGVPTSIESGMFGSSRDFYDPTGAVDYDTGISAQPLVKASELPNGDCRSLPKPTSDDDYEQCAHFYPEFWGNPLKLVLQQKIEPPQGTGFLGVETWFVTKFTADEYPQFVSYHGLRKPMYRQLLAETFQHPTTFIDYCEEISIDNCTTPDDIAKRPPKDSLEANRMFIPEVYTGYFRMKPQNNCTLYPTNCTGHIANYPCGWSSNMEANLYHMNIPLDPKNGPYGSPGGYTADQLREMWHAANATKSHLMMAWWSPEPLYQQYLGTDAELQRVTLKPYTRECANARSEWKDECSDNITIRVGSPSEACDNPTEPLRKLINVGLKDILDSPNIPEVARSPAYDVLRLFQIDDIQLGELFDLLESPTLSPRDAVCTWASQNLNVLNSTIPYSYPRVTTEQSHDAFGYVTIAIGCLATTLIMLTSWKVYQHRRKASIQFAQLDFLAILLLGSFLVGIGSILLSVPASDGTCLASTWFVNVGYTLELVPLIIKVAAINRMMEAARSLRRITIARKQLYQAVVFISICLIIYLTVWSILDPPKREAEYSLTEEMTDHGERIVGKNYYCSGGDSGAWQFVAVAWNAVLLLIASVLAFQTRNVVQKFNESRTLAFLIYSHFVFVVLRISTILLSDHLNGVTLDYIQSLIYAVDQVAMCVIYFMPKLTRAAYGDEDSSSWRGNIDNLRNGGAFVSAPFGQTSSQVYLNNHPPPEAANSSSRVSHTMGSSSHQDVKSSQSGVSNTSEPFLIPMSETDLEGNHNDKEGAGAAVTEDEDKLKAESKDQPNIHNQSTSSLAVSDQSSTVNAGTTT